MQYYLFFSSLQGCFMDKSKMDLPIIKKNIC
jgi:hypothetical protein